MREAEEAALPPPKSMSTPTTKSEHLRVADATQPDDDAELSVVSHGSSPHLSSAILLRGEQTSPSSFSAGTSPSCQTTHPLERRNTIAENCLCPMCTEVLVEPVVCPCGHCFCRHCLDHQLLRAHTNVCPIDQTALPEFLSVCPQLKMLVCALYPEEVVQRTKRLQERERIVWDRLESIVAQHRQNRTPPVSSNNSPALHKKALPTATRRSSATLLHLLDSVPVVRRAPGSSLPRYLDAATTDDSDVEDVYNSLAYQEDPDDES